MRFVEVQKVKGFRRIKVGPVKVVAFPRLKHYTIYYGAWSAEIKKKEVED